MRILPIINELNAEKSVVQLVKPAYSLTPQLEIEAYPAIFLYSNSDQSSYTHEICATQTDSNQFGIQFIARNITDTEEQLEDAREEVRSILINFRSPIYNNANILRVSGGVLNVDNSVISWVDIYQVNVQSEVQ